MGIKINIGVTKKIGTPNYGSRGASCNAEFELDGSLDNGGVNRFQESAQRAYAACRAAVDNELAAGDEDSQSEPMPNDRHIAPPKQIRRADANEPNGRHANGSNGVRKATASQVRAIHAIASRQRINLKELLPNWYQVGRPEDLSIGDASSLIDQLKGANGETANSAQKGTEHDGPGG